MVLDSCITTLSKKCLQLFISIKRHITTMWVQYRFSWLTCMACMLCRWFWRLFRTVSRRKCHIVLWNTWSLYLQRVCEANNKKSQAAIQAAKPASHKRQECRGRVNMNKQCVFGLGIRLVFSLFFGFTYLLCSVINCTRKHFLLLLFY